MAYRRRHGVTRSATFKEEIYHHNDHDNDDHDNGIENENGSLAARAMKASAAHRDSAAYGYAYAADSSSSSSASTSSSHSDSLPHRDADSHSKVSFLWESSSTKEANDGKYGFWGILAQKAKAILEEDGLDPTTKMKPQVNDLNRGNQLHQSSHPSSEGGSRIDSVKLRQRLDAITSSLNNLGDTIGNAFEEGRTIIENKTEDIIQGTRNKTADIIQETQKFQIRRRGGSTDAQDQATVLQNSSWQRPVVQPAVNKNNQGTQLKASRDVAMATAAKAKVLLRELKAAKAELAFAKQRSAQLEEENKRLRESREKGDNPADDDLIRLQLESLLAEKARLAHENAIHARENRFLREIVEYHRLTMQDIVYLDESSEEVTEDYPFSIEDASTPTSPMSPFSHDVSSLYFPTQIREHKSDALRDEHNNMTCSSSSSFSPPKPSPLGYRSEMNETLDNPTTLQRVEDEKRGASSSTKPSSSGDEDLKRPSVS
uniref:Uncharacterized protein n=1 Tax=Opuntia streptacantha TaxID=393608 RepID=A0A7C8YS26_OPUST